MVWVEQGDYPEADDKDRNSTAHLERSLPYLDCSVISKVLRNRYNSRYDDPTVNIP